MSFSMQFGCNSLNKMNQGCQTSVTSYFLATLPPPPNTLDDIKEIQHYDHEDHRCLNDERPQERWFKANKLYHNKLLQTTGRGEQE